MLRKLLCTILFLATPFATAQVQSPAEPERFGDLLVYRTVFNSSFLQPDTAANVGLERGPRHGVINIAVQRQTPEGPVAVDAIVRRMSGRRTDPETGEVYHVEHNPPPAEVADRVVQRPDDREETIRHRLEVYETSTRPLVNHYEAAGVPVHRIDGDRAIDTVQQELLGIVGA